MLGHLAPGYKAYSFLERGSNERQLCAPGIDLPVTSVMRSRYGCYAEYHTSLDDLSLVTLTGLTGGFMAAPGHRVSGAGRALRDHRAGRTPARQAGLYPDLSTRYSGWQVREMMNLLAYSDGKLTLFEIAETIGAPFWRVEPLARMLLDAGLLRRLSPQPDYSITR